MLTYLTESLAVAYGSVHARFLEEIIPGVYTLPQILCQTDRKRLLALPATPVSCGPGSGDEDDGSYYWEEELKRERERMRKEQEKKQEKEKQEPQEPKKQEKPSACHAHEKKPTFVPWVSRLLWPYVYHLRIGNMWAAEVDPYVKLYKMGVNESVGQHIDADFAGPHNSLALCSLLLFLNDDYSGGETVFNSTVVAHKGVVGGGLLFRHDILHEGRPVLKGVKCVLKTDLFFRA